MQSHFFIIFTFEFFSACFDDENHILMLLKQFKTNMSSLISDNGHIFSTSLASSSFIVSAHYHELFFGLSQVKKLIFMVLIFAFL